MNLCTKEKLNILIICLEVISLVIVNRYYKGIKHTKQQ